MDPQACLARIIQIIRRTHDTTRPRDDLDYDWSDLADAFDDLAGWLKKGGFSPSAEGAIFGTGPVSVGYPGMTLQSPPRFVQRPIKHVRSSQSNWRFSILTKDPHGEDLSRWIFVAYDHAGRETQRWDLAAGFCCPTCNSKGFKVSSISPLRCSFCDGTEGGHEPEAETDGK